MNSISENILLFISGFGIVQAFLMAGLLFFHPRSDRSVSSFLALYIICVSIPMFLPLVQHLFSWQTFIFIAPFTLLIGPSLYLYIRSFKEVITWQKAWPHFLLCLVYFFIIWRVTTVLGSKYPAVKYIPREVLRSPFTMIPVTIRMIQLLVYYFLSRKVLISYQQSIRHLFSETSRIDLSWVRLVINGYLLIVVTSITMYSLVLIYSDYFSLFTLINAAVSTPYIYSTTFKGVAQPTLWQIRPEMNKEKVETEIHKAEEIEIEIQKINHEKPKPIKAVLNENKIDEIGKKIIALLEEEKLYTETELTLQQLADRIQFPTYQVSQAINDGMNKNFYDLVNGYRVQEAKRLLIDPKSINYTILSVGFEAGFNSKTTFNTVFKKFTGFTPTEFRNKKKEVSVPA